MRNEYDNETFFQEYAQMTRSRQGLAGAGEWYQLKKMFPDLKGKKVLDLGCGYGWHCKYAVEQGAAEVLGLDLSEKMIAEAKQRNAENKITYKVCGLEEYDYPQQVWDVVVSNLVLHYVGNLTVIFRKVHQTLKPNGTFVFNIEHPVFTAGVGQDWIYGKDGKALYWPVDDYFKPGQRNTHFLGCEVEKQHHTLTQIFSGLLEAGFAIEAVQEAQPSEEMLGIPGMQDELRRPMMLMIAAKRKE